MQVSVAITDTPLIPPLQCPLLFQLLLMQIKVKPIPPLFLPADWHGIYSCLNLTPARSFMTITLIPLPAANMTPARCLLHSVLLTEECFPACCLYGPNWSFPSDTFPSLYPIAQLSPPPENWLGWPWTPACCLVGSGWTIASLYPYSVFTPPGHQNPDGLMGHVPKTTHA